MPSLRAPRKLIVVVDSNEKNPILFPPKMEWTTSRAKNAKRYNFHIEVVKKRLIAGDYKLDDETTLVQLQDYEQLVGFERKGSLSELVANFFTKDRARFERAIFRMKGMCKYNYLLLDIPLRKLCKTRYADDPPRIMDEVYRFCIQHRIQVWWANNATQVSTREALGEQIVRLLWNHVWMETLERKQHVK